MKTKTRILSALLTVFLLLSALATGSVAAEETAEAKTLPQKLGWSDLGGSYPGTYNKNWFASVATEAGNHRLHLKTGSTWRQIEIVPAQAMEGVKQYSISFKAQVTSGGDISWHDKLMFHFGTATIENLNGNWAGISYGTDNGGGIASWHFTNGNQGGTSQKTGYLKDILLDLTVKVDTEAGVFRIYDSADLTKALTETTTTHNVAGAIGLIFGNMYGWIDDIRVTNDANGDVIYSEDFESLSLRGNVEYEGVQESAVKDGTYAVRFVGALGDDVALADYSEVGFRVTATWGADGTKTLDTACTTVYGKITGSADGVTSEYRADSFGAKYLFALAVEGIPTDAGQITFTVTPYYVTAAGTVTGNAYTVVYNAGALVSQTAN